MQPVGELGYDPAIINLIIKDNRVTLASGLADTAKSRPNRLDADRAKNRVAGRFIEDLVTLVHDLHILSVAHLTIGVRWSAVADNPWERNAVEVQDGRRNVGHQLLE